MTHARWNRSFNQISDSAVRIFRRSLVGITVVLLTACGTGAEPTPTPTKTPHAIGATVATPESLATSTPVPALPTETPASRVATVVPTPLPRNIAPYTGLSVADPALLRRRPLLICVTNDAVGRAAHIGLDQADLIYEYIVDGFSLTRLTAIYHSQTSERIGPIRSARMPNIWISYMFDGALACSGGTDEIRYLLRNEVTFPYLDADLDDPSQTLYFQSIGDDYRTRMQASTRGVRRWLADSGKEADWSRPGFDFSPSPPPNAVGTATQMQIAYPGGNSVEWRYDASVGGYLRWQGGVQQTDGATGDPLIAKNVIVMAATHLETDIIEDSLGTKSIDIELWGFGDLRIFRDGQVYEGTWRSDLETPPRWLGPDDANIKLKPGQSWIQVVRDTNELSY